MVTVPEVLINNSNGTHETNPEQLGEEGHSPLSSRGAVSATSQKLTTEDSSTRDDAMAAELVRSGALTKRSSQIFETLLNPHNPKVPYKVAPPSEDTDPHKYTFALPKHYADIYRDNVRHDEEASRSKGPCGL